MKLRQYAPWSLLALGLMVPSLTNCSAADELAKQGDCGATVEGKALMSAVADVEAVATNMTIGVGTACRNIAVAGGETVTWADPKAPTDDEVKASCDAAVKVIAAVKAKGSFRMVVEGEAKCEANISAQADCTAKCDANAKCNADISASCEPGKLSGECSGECSGSCEMSAAATCEGTCKGSCDASFSGTCGGTCDGKCDGQDSSGACKGKCEGKCDAAAEGTCGGSCKGSCELTAKASCSGQCTGSCSVEMKAPKCEGEVKASCEAKAECSGSCRASAQAKATCTPPKVKIEADASVDTKVIDALQAELPKLITVTTAQGKALVNVLGEVKTSFEAAVKGSAACALQVKGFVKASASINVSVSASASASGEASSN